MTRIQVRRDTSANWASVNPTPAEGEPCFETDTGKFKIGNGQQPYNSLPYQTAEEIPVATTSTAGLVKPDGTTITITPDGTISSAGGTLPDNVVTTDTVQTITGRKAIADNVQLWFGNTLRDGKIYLRTSTPALCIETGTDVTNGIELRSATKCLGRIQALGFDIGSTTNNTEFASYSSTGSVLTIGNTANLTLKSPNAPNINRNGQTYTNIDSGNISEQFNASKAMITSWFAPSTNITTLSLGASGTTYTAPKTGYFSLWLQDGAITTGIPPYATMRNNTTRFGVGCSFDKGGYSNMILPAKKGDIIHVFYTPATLQQDLEFKFINAEGSNV